MSLSFLAFGLGVDHAVESVNELGFGSLTGVFLVAGTQAYDFYVSTNYLVVAFAIILLAGLVFPARAIFLGVANSIVLVGFALLTLQNPTIPSPFSMATDVFDGYKRASDFAWMIIAFVNFFVPIMIKDKKKA